MRIAVIPNQQDNYSYLLIDRTNKAAAIDIFDVAKVEDAAEREGVQIVANLTTHYHRDHSGGNKVSIYYLMSMVLNFDCLWS
jgi:hydroxyacylglutathione hydrolase